MNYSREIFRHLRPHDFDPYRKEITPNQFGGLSFLVHPINDEFDFWVYICPNNTTFSARQAVKSLRERAANGVVPFGTFTPSEEPLIDQLINYVSSANVLLPTEIGAQAHQIIQTNERALSLRARAYETCKVAL